MSCNKYTPHLLVLPEDDANRQIAVGFVTHTFINTRGIQIMTPANGWEKTVKLVEEDCHDVKKNAERRLLLLVDFDGNQNRFENIMNRVPEEIKNRVFVLGILSEPEQLKSQTQKSYEEIGSNLGEDCPDHMNELWQHPLLRHNQTELERLLIQVSNFLFLDPRLVP